MVCVCVCQRPVIEPRGFFFLFFFSLQPSPGSARYPSLSRFPKLNFVSFLLNPPIKISFFSPIGQSYVSPPSETNKSRQKTCGHLVDVFPSSRRDLTVSAIITLGRQGKKKKKNLGAKDRGSFDDVQRRIYSHSSLQETNGTRPQKMSSSSEAYSTGYICLFPPSSSCVQCTVLLWRKPQWPQTTPPP